MRVEIITTRDDGKLTVQMNNNTLYGNLCLLEAVLDSLDDALTEVAKQVPDDEGAIYDEYHAVIVNTKHRLNQLEDAMSETATDETFKWLDSEVGSEATQ